MKLFSGLNKDVVYLIWLACHDYGIYRINQLSKRPAWCKAVFLRIGT